GTTAQGPRALRLRGSTRAPGPGRSPPRARSARAGAIRPVGLDGLPGGRSAPGSSAWGPAVPGIAPGRMRLAPIRSARAGGIARQVSRGETTVPTPLLYELYKWGVERNLPPRRLRPPADLFLEERRQRAERLAAGGL